MSDWDSVTIIGSKARVGGGGPRAQVAKTAAQINAARRTGSVLSVDKKYGSTNKASDVEGQRLTKIDRADDIVAVKKLDPAVGKAIAKARTEKKLSQKDLATKVNEKPNVINDYEAARAAPNQQLLGKLERALGVKLRGKDIGAPLFGPKNEPVHGTVIEVMEVYKRFGSFRENATCVCLLYASFCFSSSIEVHSGTANADGSIF